MIYQILWAYKTKPRKFLENVTSLILKEIEVFKNCLKNVYDNSCKCQCTNIVDFNYSTELWENVHLNLWHCFIVKYTLLNGAKTFHKHSHPLDYL